MSMTRELANQKISGREMTEREIYLRMLQHFGELHTLARGLAISRKDTRWLHVARLIDQMGSNTKTLMMKPMGLVIPGFR